jgi:hypothetical protein
MMKNPGRKAPTAVTLAFAACLATSAFGAGEPQSDETLAKAAQNPVADMISLPFQDNLTLNYGPDDDLQNVLNIQPVWPFRLGKEWNLISRTILPLVYQPGLEPGQGSAFGLGDLNETAFFSPAKPGKVIWGAGPILTIPTATDDMLGTGKWLAGPAFVVLAMPGHWVVGALVNNQWSFAGDSSRPAVNTMLLQYFVNYNFKHGTYLSSAPIITANWKAPSGDKWLVPIGIAAGQIFKAGKQPMNAQVGLYYNLIHPDGLPYGNWQVRLQLALLFPRS